MILCQAGRSTIRAQQPLPGPSSCCLILTACFHISPFHPLACLPAEAYEPEYEHSVMYCQEYRPSDLRMADNGAWGGREKAAALGAPAASGGGLT